MEEHARSDNSSQVVVKSRNASGCLIVRKKANGMPRPGAAAPSGLPANANKDKKRHRMTGHNGVGSSAEPYHRKEVFRTSQVFHEFENGYADQGAVRSDFDRTEGGRYRKRHRSDFLNSDGLEEGFQMERHYNGGGSMYAEISGRNSVGGDAATQWAARGDALGVNEQGEDIRHRRRHSESLNYMAGGDDDDDRGLNYYGDRNRYSKKSNGSLPPLTSANANLTTPPSTEEYIRIQGKNGVLKVKINRIKGTGFLKAYGHHKPGDFRIESGNENTIRRNETVRPSSFAEDRCIPHEQAVVFGRADKHLLKTDILMPTRRSRPYDSPSDDSGTSLNLGLRRGENQYYSGIAIRDGKNNPAAELSLPTGGREGKQKRGNGKDKHKLQLLPTKSNNECDSQSEDGDMSLKLGSSRAENHKFAELGKSEENRTTPPEKCHPTGSKEGKQKRGSGTEKQKLREHIRKMLLDAGWTIDYRPRRNRDYQDAVYVSPSGTAFWSIVKAYEGLQKQFAEDNRKPEPVGDGSPFSPVADDILSKLTRQTRKKMEKEMKKKGRNGEGSGNLHDRVSKKSAKEMLVAENAVSDEGEYQMCSLIKEDHKSLDDMANENNISESPRTIKKHSRRTLLVRTVNKRLSSNDNAYVPYTGKRTLLSWLIDCGSVKLNEKVQYMNRKQTRALQQGWISRDGIHCLCCSKIVTISKFELHAGRKVHQPLQSIFLESGVSLLQCMIDAWNKQTKLEQDNFHQVNVKEDDRNDDICGICGDGGDLICCDGCPSTYHQNCLGVEILPPGEWHCPNCRCRHCGLADDDNAEGSGGTFSSLLACSFCERKYHQSCLTDVEIDSYCSSFCDVRCRELCETLQKFVGVKHDLGSGFSWSIIHRTDIESDTSLQDLAVRVECNSKLAISQEIMDECFLPIVDQRSGIDIIHHVVYNYGSNFNRLNFSKFYTATLERGDEIISAASLRFHGAEFAEMPFIGTRHIHRRQGMCRRLLCAIETALRLFKVKQLVIPAISELMHTWTEVFSFSHISESDKTKFRSMNILVFPGVDMLQKPLLEQSIFNEVAACTLAVKSSAHERLPKMLTKSEEDWSAETDHDGDGLRSTNETGNQVGTSSSESDSDHQHANNTFHPSSPTDLDFPPRISVLVSEKDDNAIPKSEDCGDAPEGTPLLNNQDALGAMGASENANKAATTSYAFGSSSSES
uniref:PHD-type domain-containing protein n=1 Tax=Kalanchoe fedtschenkoi TaxID=63787 RepID=A0A7N0TKU2_KALFE